MDGPRYIVGIDLGTTNCALAYVDTAVAEDERAVCTMPIPQLVAAGEVAELPVLPSFIYLPEQDDVAAELLILPWQTEAPSIAVGTFARTQAAQLPGKVVASAKSWLCCETVDRRSACLPWDHGDVPRQISPVDAARVMLEHLQEAWNWKMAREDDECRLENQHVILTVPASFDAVSRELTADAARQAGLSVRLFEEPQAAFYAWLHRHANTWRDQVGAGDVILVCDIGGGTSDFSLIAVLDEGGDLTLERLAVGDHTLLGGDNMDLTLAYGMAAKIKREQGVTLDGYQMAALTHACREAKEALGEGAGDVHPLTVLGRGSGLIGGSIATDLTSGELDRLLIDGFFPLCELTDRPLERRRVGLRSFGLEYASDAALTRHLAAFLSRNRLEDEDGNTRLPNVVLFNGGVTKSDVFRNRITDAIQAWNNDAEWKISVLEKHDADLSVAMGAAWYGNIQFAGGVRIKAGSPRSYYLGVESSLPAVPGFAPPVQALCVVNFGLEEGSSVDIDVHGLGLVVGEPIDFRFFSSTCRQQDAVGTRLDGWSDEELEELPPLGAELPLENGEPSSIGTLTPVSLRVELTEIGTLQLWCDEIGGDRSWQLEFELRDDRELIA